MPKKLSVDQLAEYGFTAGGEVMDNRELRVRCMHESGSGYIWTQPPEGAQPEWQNAHYHCGIRETYIVERGEMAFAVRLPDGDCVVQVYGPGTVVTSQPEIAHNVYLFAGAAIHTVKHGEPVGNPEKGGADWYPADSGFDAWTKRLSEESIRELSGK